MKSLKYILILSFTLLIVSCKSISATDSEPNHLEQTLGEKNRATVSLLNRIQKLSGISLRNGLPSLGKASNSTVASGELLYILDDYIVGNSFESVNDLVESFKVKKVELLTGSDASFYGSRAGSGVIKITTY